VSHNVYVYAYDQSSFLKRTD